MQHTRTRTQAIIITETIVTYDRCNCEMHPNDQDSEHQECIAVRFRRVVGGSHQTMCLSRAIRPQTRGSEQSVSGISAEGGADDGETARGRCGKS